MSKFITETYAYVASHGNVYTVLWRMTVAVPGDRIEALTDLQILCI